MPEGSGQNSPHSVGIIMDGNRRWAKAKGLPAFEGHKAGYERMKEVLHWSKEAGVKNVTVFAFSTENWKRAEDEVGYLMELMRFVFRSEMETLRKEKVRVLFAGDLSKLPADLQKDCERVKRETSSGFEVTLTLCVSYGGRDEILRAARRIAAAKIAPEEITEEYFSSVLDTADTPDPDLIIRTSGEQRVSGFLPWQSVYSELFFTDTLWPDLSKGEYLGILEKFGERNRRHGK